MFFQWFVGLSLFTIPIAFFVRKKTSSLCALLFLYVSIYVLYTALYSRSIFAGLSPQARIGFSLAATMGYVSALIPFFALLVIRMRNLKSIFSAIPLYCLTNSLYVIYNYLVGFKYINGYGTPGFYDYSGMNGVLLAVTVVPSLKALSNSYKDKLAWVVVSFAMVALVLSRGSVAFGVVFCGVLAIAVKEHFRAHAKWVALASVFSVLLLALISEKGQLFDSGQRMTAYRIFLSQWWVDGHIWFGYGPSTFQILSSGIQKHHNFMTSGNHTWVWLWAHSDYIQELVQLGVIGIILIGGVILETLYKLLKSNDTTAFALAIALASSSIFDYSCRLFPTAFLICLVVVYAYRLQELSDSSLIDS